MPLTGSTARWGISRTLWARACQVMGRSYAAVDGVDAPARAFHEHPGGYFAGMRRKCEKGELRLAGTLWAQRGEMGQAAQTGALMTAWRRFDRREGADLQPYADGYEFDFARGYQFPSRRRIEPTKGRPKLSAD